MREIKYPERKTWKELSSRPEMQRSALDSLVMDIIRDVRISGDRALVKYAREFDGASISGIEVTMEEIGEAAKRVPGTLMEAIMTAKSNIEKFHSSQIIEEPVIETMKGVRCWRRSVPVEKAGLYIPGGSAPLFSSVLMLAVPAMIAGCREIIMCTPPSKNGSVDPALLYTASVSGITKIFKTGGAQAVAAMAYGTESIPAVDKIFGPGNQYVTRAKQLVQLDGIAIDMPAGPSEVLVIADKSANPEFVAADLLSQAEHGSDSQVVLVTDSSELTGKVRKEMEIQLKSLPRKITAEEALKSSLALLMNNLDECMEFSNIYAPEHLIINTADAGRLAMKVINAGSVFIGNYSCESAGDYASGTNHTLPTNSYARSYSGISTESFMKRITFQELSPEGLANIGKTIETMAEAEQLAGHKNAVTIRLKSIINEQGRQAGKNQHN